MPVDETFAFIFLVYSFDKYIIKRLLIDETGVPGEIQQPAVSH
jgi:hypothetical protein